MKIISKHSSGRKLKQDGYQISAIAKAKKLVDDSVVDCTLGTFFYEDGGFRGHKTVKKVDASLTDRERFSYAISEGGKDFEEAVKKWFFKHTLEDVEKELLVKVVPTPGGTGALYSSVFNSMDPGETILIPEPCWGPYLTISRNLGYEIERFFLFKDDKFDLEGFIEKCEKVKAKQNKLVIMLNDPCNNPTGYTMDEEELKALIEYLNSDPTVPCTLIYDTAYLDMAIEGMDKVRDRLKVFALAKENVFTSIIFSASKTLFIYGERLGAQIILGKNKENVIDYFNACVYTARSTWSNCNHGMMSLFVKINDSEELKKELDEEINQVVNVLKERSEIFLKETKEVGLVTYPYKSGFFITIPCKNNQVVFEKLIEKEKVYLTLSDNSVRVAICSVPKKEVYGLAGKIKSVIDEFGK